MSAENVAAASTCARSGSGYNAIGDTTRSSSAGGYDGGSGNDEADAGVCGSGGGAGSGACANAVDASSPARRKDKPTERELMVVAFMKPSSATGRANRRP